MSVHLTPSRRRALALSVTSLLVPLFASPAGAACDASTDARRAVPEVTTTVLPALDGRTEFPTAAPLPTDINNQGQIVGQSFDVTDSGEVLRGTPTLWQDGKPTALPSATAFGTIAAHVNERGQVLVDSTDVSYVWTDGEVAELPAPSTEAVDLDDRGRVLMRLTSRDAAVWEDGELTPITPPGDPVVVRVYDLSEAGHVTGGALTDTPSGRPFIWQDGSFTQLSGAGEGWRVNRSGQVISWGTFWDVDGTATPLDFDALDLNDRGQVVGYQTVDADPVNPVTRAVLWEDGQLTDLGTLGGKSSRARHINERGQVVGVSQTADGVWHHFVWTGGQMIPLAPSLGDNAADDINDNGQIIGQTRRGEPGAWINSAVLWEVHDDASELARREPTCSADANSAAGR
jgi:probable HAF family extracellular repeat protein